MPKIISKGIRMRADQQKAFEEYDHVMANIAVFEAFMRVALVQRENPKSEVERKKRSEKLTRMDFGQLLQQVYQKFKLPSEFLERIKKTKAVRDDLAHTFWVAHLGKLHTERGTEIIRRQLRLYSLELVRAVEILLAATLTDTQSYIEFVNHRTNDPSFYEGWEAMLEQAEQWEAENGSGG